MTAIPSPAASELRVPRRRGAHAGLTRGDHATLLGPSMSLPGTTRFAFAACLLAAGCAQIIGADFGNYRVAPSDAGQGGSGAFTDVPEAGVGGRALNGAGGSVAAGGRQSAGGTSHGSGGNAATADGGDDGDAGHPSSGGASPGTGGQSGTSSGGKPSAGGASSTGGVSAGGGAGAGMGGAGTGGTPSGGAGSTGAGGSCTTDVCGACVATGCPSCALGLPRCCKMPGVCGCVAVTMAVCL